MHKPLSPASLLAFVLPAVLAAGALPLMNLAKGVEVLDVESVFSTDVLQGTLNRAVVGVAGRSPDPHRVYVGRDGHIFLGDRYARTASRTRGILRPDSAGVAAHAEEMAALQADLADRETVFAIVIAPNKSSIEREALPDWMQPQAPRVTDAYAEGLVRAGVNLVDLRAPVRELAEEGQVYAREDSHWLNPAAARGYEVTMDALDAARRALDPQSERLRRPAYDVVPRKATVSANAGLIKMGEGRSEDVGAIAFETPREMCVTELDTGFAAEGAPVCGPLDYIWVNFRRVKVEAQPAENPQGVLWLSDSFGANRSGELGNGPLVHASFATVWNGHYKFMDPDRIRDFVARERPDIVMIQMVERSFPLWVGTVVEAELMPGEVRR